MPISHRWTTEGFIDAFLTTHRDMEDTAFAFVLGAGASKDSDIPTGGELVHRWLDELRRRHDDKMVSLEAWATSDNVGIENFEFGSAASFYPQVFERRFGDYLDEGYAALETVMKDKAPSFGYSVLAQILSGTRHRAVVTTNFDNLVSDALYLYTSTVPLICSHESLAHYIRTRMRRPVIAKVHRDVLLNPFNDAQNTSKLSEHWVSALKTIFANFSPVFVGYGGNDGSLMGFLESLEPGQIAGRMYWCYMRNQRIQPRVEALVQKHRGALVPIDGFDKLMLQLSVDVFGYPLLDKEIIDRASARAVLYRMQFNKLAAKEAKEVKSTVSTRATTDAVLTLIAPEQAGSVSDDDDSDRWWVPVLQASREPSAQKREALLRSAIQRFPDEPQVVTAFAWHVVVAGGDRREVEQLVDSALQHHGHNAELLTIRARLFRAEGKFEEAHDFYLRALKAEPDDDQIQSAYAVFIAEDLGQFEEAKAIFVALLNDNPRDRNRLNFAEVLMVAGHIEESDEIWEQFEETESTDTLSGVIAFHRGLIARLRDESDATYLGRLKWLLMTRSEPTEWWNFDAAFRMAEAKPLPPDIIALYRRIATAMIDIEKRVDLEMLSIWNAIAPVPMERKTR
ncbi:MAG: tetratricopeptide repeat protein [Acidobacteria bacterium]|nr:tetratricopeptide repeat protein [Acidobacteriota bacterium]MBV9067266.1 tetratricopeptide repeat protein [Acidobacteriota bacterium]MBV9185139.1 tetratricopeptide repeat protein [Acidobacteriota bacterium]